MEKVINFSFAPSIEAEQRDAALRTISDWSGVVHVAPLRPESKNLVVSRMAFVRVAPDADIALLLGKLQALAGVEHASIPSLRTLAR